MLNRIGFGPRPGDLSRVGAIGLDTYIDQQLHPERIADEAVEERLAALTSLAISTQSFAAGYYLPMIAARESSARRQKLEPGPQPMTTPEEVEFQRQNQRVFSDLQAQKLLRAVYSERQLEEVLADFWFNHFNVDEQKPGPASSQKYERDAIRPTSSEVRDSSHGERRGHAVLSGQLAEHAPPPEAEAIQATAASTKTTRAS